MKKLLAFLVLSFALTSTVYALNNPQGDGRKTVASAGTAEALSSSATPYMVLNVCAEADNTGVIAVGTSPVAALATREGVYLNAGDCYTITHRGLLSETKIDATVNGDGVTYDYYYN